MDALATKSVSRDCHPARIKLFASVLPFGHGGECTASRAGFMAGDVGDP
jgi:hypothetical protein